VRDLQGAGQLENAGAAGEGSNKNLGVKQSSSPGTYSTKFRC